jgi:Amidohydrolase
MTSGSETPRAATGRAAEVRAALHHPVIDADGHFVELRPVMEQAILGHLSDLGGARLRDRYLASGVAPYDTTSVHHGTVAQRRRTGWNAIQPWWSLPVANARDRATSHLPALLHERLDEIGTDFALLYPSSSLMYLDVDDDELAGALCRSVNREFSRMFSPYSRRMTAAALIPMNTPDVALAELRYAVDALGAKLVVLAGHFPRFTGTPVADGPTEVRLDTFGLDGAQDYDEVWAACCELGVAPATHSSFQLKRLERSASSYVFNHINGFASAHEALCKSLFLGGVTRRFPDLRFGFLEGGVSWACSLWAELVGHWQKRNASVISRLDPQRLDVEVVRALFDTYGDDGVRAMLDEVLASLSTPGGAPPDDFGALEAQRVEDLLELFVPHFYFGCEGDDPLVRWAFATDTNPLGARLRPMYGSDVSHWDVDDMTEPLAEAYEQVEHGHLSDQDFRDFTFANAVRCHGGANPAFFEGTICQEAARACLDEPETSSSQFASTRRGK